MFLIEAAAKAFRSLGTPGIFGMIIQTVLFTLLCLFGFVVVVSWLAFHLAAGISTAWIADMVKWGTSFGSGIMAWLLFPGIMPIIVSFFDNKIATAIEAHDYAIAPTAPPVNIWPEVLHDTGFTLKAIALNILCLPLYLVPVVNLCIFYVLNGYLLGREFFVMVARRHMSVMEAEQLRRKYSGAIFWGGVCLTLLATIPIINLIAPFWGVALAVHLFHQIYDRKLLTSS